MSRSWKCGYKREPRNKKDFWGCRPFYCGSSFCGMTCCGLYAGKKTKKSRKIVKKIARCWRRKENLKAIKDFGLE